MNSHACGMEEDGRLVGPRPRIPHVMKFIGVRWIGLNWVELG